MKNSIVYSNGEIELEVSIEKESVWLSAKDIAMIFDVNRPAIVKHIGNIYKTDELLEKSTCSILEQVASDGKKRRMNFYNLEMIISVGYRVNSLKATKFRQWATSVLKNYIQDGYVINGNKITNERFVSLENDVNSLKKEINNISKMIKNDNLDIKQGIFYNGQIFDAYSFISDLIREAKKNIILIDNFVDDSVLILFSKNQNIDVTIYTNSISKQLKLDVEKYNAQYRAINIKNFKDSHDRFLIIDDEQIYHIGASLKDLGKKWFAFSKMDMQNITIVEKLKEEKK
ncbi:MAG: virulence RhuM family protein [Epsilonproteobacteria bacterium]|nr:virulence RhuM family protein [Campylobacterota bacterium]OIO13871.1 MAG: DNA-binding protein [Helicobacteraceae bacterium CG1_02_36_14]PIP11510.1 MAG: DNA-binding protein [Sulfurimonas sp. CG23_combo_of_CG06-09_8_20_14_all_36_33]PIS24993.1 MAG: DNA-binding protein [Sulfurimonas sp. CG08_land_8_20_14_0_20_36_33]PIU34871.1 MAG: DNA-binding protein [Sulfurimonas sp. CG07_land_8_20_14_0_80_36_56]PIV04533.1 MAG: DNA-binding protein [Sulfurimonas sp. CG03_land_8_20_14_0_80_36_25]PIV36923.1 MAG: